MQGSFVKRFISSVFKFSAALIFLSQQNTQFFAQSSPLTFSEVMFNPSESNGEYVEIFNTSLTDTIDLAGYSINYNNASSNDTMKLVSSSSKLNPGHYAIVLEGDYNFISGEYINIIPANAVLFMISDSSFGTSTYGMAGTSDRTVYLKNPIGEIFDTYTYSAINTPGYSDEKVEMTKDNSPSNWGNSASLHGTPGSKNSVSPLDYDLKIKFNAQSPSQPLAGDSVNVTFIIINCGLNDAQNFVVNLYDDVNYDSIGQNDELMFTNNYPLLPAGDSIIVSKNIYADTAGVYSFIAEVIYVLDENNTNNKSILRFDVSEKPAEPFEVIINEFMYSPPPDQPEWIEIYNRSDKVLNLKKWKVGDNSSLIELASSDYFLNPGEYLVISDEASISDYYTITSKLIIKSLPSLNNTGDEIRIKNENGITIDSIKYSSSWGSSGKSLERISKDISGNTESNWQSSIALLNGTPGSDNSVSQKNYDVCAKIISAPQNPFVGDNITVNILVKNIGKLIAQNIKVSLYDDTNNDLFAQAYEQFASKNIDVLNAGDSTSISFIINISALRVYNLIAEVVCPADENPYNNNDLIKITPIEEPAGLYDVVINEFNFAPSTGEPEWIEIYNRSASSINLKNWKIGNDNASVIITGDDLYINRGEYIVISRSTSLNKFHKIKSQLIVKSFPAMDNTSGVIILKNNYEGKIDEVSYSSDWGGGNGKSIERIDVNSKSSNAENWKTTESKFKGTPGRINSVSKKKYDLCLSSIEQNNNYLEVGSPADINMNVKNLGSETVSNFSLILFCDKNLNGFFDTDEDLNKLQNQKLNTGLTIEQNFNIENFPEGKNIIYAFTDFKDDQFNDNDTISFSINVVKINEQRNDIIIYEIMYAPVSPEPEWIEIFNRSNKEINLLGYNIGDDASKIQIVSKPLIVKPGEYFVFAKDSSIFSVYSGLTNCLITNFSSLNNLQDQVILTDSLGRVIDSLKYNSTWGGDSGKSLERIQSDLSSTDSTNWRTSVAPINGSPSKINSVSPKNFDAAVTDFFSVPSIPKYGEDVTIAVKIENYGKYDAACILILYEITESNTRVIREHTTQNIIYANSSMEYPFAYKVPAIETSHSFEVDLIFEADEFPYDNKKTICITPVCLPRDILLNEVMYNPVNGEPEWIELYNTTKFNIDLSSWSIIDLLTKPISTKIDHAKVFSKSYLVIAKDSTIVNYHREIPTLIINKFANLNNDEDGVTIKDCLGNTIDSVLFNKSWGGESGKSIERKSLDSSSTNKQNWASSTDIELSTPGRINSISQKEYDLRLEKFYCEKKYVEYGSHAMIYVTIKNIGINKAEHFFVKLFKDYASDLDEAKELLSVKEFNDFINGDTLLLDFNISAFDLGTNNLFAEIEYDLDQNTENNFGYCKIECIKINEIYNDIVLNEIMYSPVSPEPEWIEIFNRSNKEINLLGYNIGDDANKNKIVSYPIIIKPGEYFVFAKDSTIFSVYSGLENIIVTDFPSLNNSQDQIVLIDSLGRVIDSVKYNSTWGGGFGKSLERIQSNRSSTDSTNWGTSVAPFNGSPSQINSVSPKNYDAAVSKLFSNPLHPQYGQDVFIRAELINFGKSDAICSMVLYEITEGDIKKVVENSPLITISPQSAVEYSFINKIVSIECKHTFELEVLLNNDEYIYNNNKTISVIPGCAAGWVMLNEIMFNPINEEPEWLELYNTTSYNIDISNWSITDLQTKPASTKISNGIISPKSYLVIAKDSTITNYHRTIPSSIIINKFANLNNDEDGIVIKDCYNNTIDSIHYTKSWGGESGKSIERKSLDSSSTNKQNWSSSTDIELSTPGRINSISQKEYDLLIKDFYCDKKYVEFGRVETINVVVENIGINKANQFNVRLYRKFGSINSETKELISTKDLFKLPGGDTVVVNFDLIEFTKGTNYFFAIIEYALDQDTQNNFADLKVECIELNEVYNDIVINEIMHSPLSPEPEWIEIYNRSEKEINLLGYCIADDASKIEIASNLLIIKPGEYFVFANDSIIFSVYTGLKNVHITNLPPLNNSHDQIVLTDSLGRVIDSVKYKSTWGGTSGYSLERINAGLLSNDSTNWKSSGLKSGGSPSKINSVSKKNYDAAISEILFTPVRPAVGSKVDISVEVENIGVNEISFELILYELLKDGCKQSLDKSTRIILSAGKNVTHLFNYTINSIVRSCNILIELICKYDECISNNSLVASIQPAYNTGDIKVNEIMYNPVNAEPEWIELFNDSEYEIDLSGWTISDVLTNPVTVKLSSGIIRPKSFLVIAKDSGVIDFHREVFPLSVNSFANLNNDEDGVVIKDSWCNTIDSVFYNKTWGGSNGKSLERISTSHSSNEKNNWASSSDIELSTPGRINNVSQKNIDLAVYSIHTIPRSVFINDEVTIAVVVVNEGLFNAANIKIEFYFVEGNDTISFCSGFVEGINLNDSIKISSSIKVKIVEPKTVLCKIICDGDQDLSNNAILLNISTGYKRNDILISEIMYNPLDGEPEWIEIVNNSSSKVNLKNWFVSDVVSPIKTVITKKDAIIQTNEFAIISRDTSLFPFYPPTKFYEATFGSLGNSYDGIVIYDSNNNVIDSVEYNSRWGGNKGCSLERCNYNSNSCDSSNWSTTLCKDGATPGIKNTVSQINGYKRGSLVINEILYNPDANNCEFIEIFNTSEDSVELGGMRFEIGSGNSYVFSPILNKISSKCFSVLCKDSVLVNNYSNLLNNVSSLFVNKSINLSNEGTKIILRDARGNVLDSLFYSSSWNNKNIPSTKNKSLEKINPYLDSNDPKNWSTCVCPEGATPGKQNSLFIDEVISGKKVSINPNPFSPDNDGFEDFTAINLTLPHKLSQVRIKVFDSLGREVRSLTHNISAASKSTVIFDGLDDNGRALRIGIYILLIEALGSDGNIETIKTPVVIARKL